MQGWIYLYTNKVNGKHYVGQTIQLKVRDRQHTLRGRQAIDLAIKKYGRDQFDLRVLETFRCDDRELLKQYLDYAEVKYIAQYQSLASQWGYNITEGGKGGQGITHTAETKALLRELKRQALLQYSPDGKLIKKWNAVKDAERYYNCSTIGKAARGKVYSSLDCIWVKESEKDKLQEKLIQYQLYGGPSRKK